MIVLFTDYGLAGPYIGQVESVFHLYAPNEKVINLFADVPRNNPKAGSYLLAAYSKYFPGETIFFCVIDPGVGSFKDKPVAMRIDNRWYVGPDNGLFDIVARRARTIECWEIIREPEKLSGSFHGRDLYAPVCAALATGEKLPAEKMTWSAKQDWPDDLYEIIYIDHFGNAMTGIRSGNLGRGSILVIRDTEISHAATFSSVSKGRLFWYENSNELVEISCNLGDAGKYLDISVGDKVSYL